MSHLYLLNNDGYGLTVTEYMDFMFSLADNYDIELYNRNVKKQYLPIVPKSADAIVDKSVIRVGEATITASRCVQCLGVCIDRHLDMKKLFFLPAKH